jgi:hypothetical protein
MMAKWFLAAALFGGMAVSVPAAEKPHYPIAPAPAVQLEIRGRLRVLVLEDKGFPEARSWPERRVYQIEADGQTFTLNIGTFAGQANKLDGQLVIVTGTLVHGPVDQELVHVTGLTVPLEASLTQYVRVTVEGELERIVLPSCDPKDGAIVLWQVRAGWSSYMLVFADAKVAAEAEKFVGRPIILTGTLKNGQITVNSVRPGVIYFLPLPEYMPDLLKQVGR